MVVIILVYICGSWPIFCFLLWQAQQKSIQTILIHQISHHKAYIIHKILLFSCISTLQTRVLSPYVSVSESTSECSCYVCLLIGIKIICLFFKAQSVPTWLLKFYKKLLWHTSVFPYGARFLNFYRHYMSNNFKWIGKKMIF